MLVLDTLIETLNPEVGASGTYDSKKYIVLYMLQVYNIYMLIKAELILEKCLGFQWDDGNVHKNWINHEVTVIECEQVFFNQPLLVVDDLKHSQLEKRYYALGKTDMERKLFIVFTIRESLIRVISARDMNKNERKIYAEQEKNTKI